MRDPPTLIKNDYSTLSWDSCRSPFPKKHSSAASNRFEADGISSASLPPPPRPSIGPRYVLGIDFKIWCCTFQRPPHSAPPTPAPAPSYRTDGRLQIYVDRHMSRRVEAEIWKVGQAFSVTAPPRWNHLPDEIRFAQSGTSLKIFFRDLLLYLLSLLLLLLHLINPYLLPVAVLKTADPALQSLAALRPERVASCRFWGARLEGKSVFWRRLLIEKAEA